METSLAADHQGAPETSRIRVFLAIEHPVVRRGLSAACNAQPDIQVVGEAADGDTARRGIRALAPDLVVTHAQLPLSESEKLLAEPFGANRSWRCIMLVPLTDRDTMERSLRLNAEAFLLTNDLPQHVVRTVREVAAGNRFICPLLEASAAYQQAGSIPDELRLLLDERDRAVFALLNRRLTKAAVAKELGLSSTDVGESRVRICHALHRRKNDTGNVPLPISPDTLFPADEDSAYFPQ